MPLFLSFNNYIEFLIQSLEIVRNVQTGIEIVRNMQTVSKLEVIYAPSLGRP